MKVNDLILSDAIEKYIEAEKKIITQRRLIVGMAVAIVLLLILVAI